MVKQVLQPTLTPWWSAPEHRHGSSTTVAYDEIVRAMVWFFELPQICTGRFSPSVAVFTKDLIVLFHLKQRTITTVFFKLGMITIVFLMKN